jgi:glycosyltransferase involved in cell wall biosynthesis
LQFDAVICHSSWTQALFGPTVKASGVSLLYWLHGAPDGNHWLEMWAGRTRPDMVICCSEFTAGLLWKVYPGVRAEVVHPPVPPIKTQLHDPAHRTALRKQLQTPDDAVVIVQASRMEEWKGHRLHLEALARMRDLPDWMCWFVGGAQRPAEERYLEELKLAAERLGIEDKVRFLGQRSDVHEVLASADVFCQPNTGPEPFGIVFVEALWAGLPVITTNFGGGLEIVDSTCGALNPPNDAAALAATLTGFVESADLRRQMSQAAPARARKLCETTQQLRQLRSLIQQTITRTGAA